MSDLFCALLGRQPSHQEHRLLVGGHPGELRRREARVHLHQVAARVLQPQLVQRRAPPGGARRLVDGPPGGLCAAVGVAVLALAFQVALAALISIALVALVWGAMLKKSLGGYTGDTLGASVVLSELVFLLLLAV